MRQTSFTRTLYNDKKMGAYYTDVGHAERLGRMFSLKGETCILEPSVGDASALTAFVNALDESENIKTFGVELNPMTYDKVKDKLHFSLNEDFLKGVRITPKAFSLCFANPPYGTMEEGDRYETAFVKKIYSYLNQGGYLVLIIPRAALEEKNFQREYAARFDTKAIYRFDDEEYEKYHQYALIGERRRSIGVLADELMLFRKKIQKDQFSFIPDKNSCVETKYTVPESKEKDVVLFTSVTFDYAQAAISLPHSVIYDKLKNVCVKPYAAMKVGNPVLPLKKDHLYLAAIAGAGEGVAGSEEARDMHLQRGTITTESYSTIVEEDGVAEEKVTTVSRAAINIIDNMGHIITLK